MKIKNIEFYIKEYKLASGKTVYSPWIKYKEKGLLWGWDNITHPICYNSEQKFWSLDRLYLYFESEAEEQTFDSLVEANNYLSQYESHLSKEIFDNENNRIISEKIVKQEDMKIE